MTVETDQQCTDALADDSNGGPLVLDAQVEGLLFVSDGPVSTGRLAEAVGVTPARIEQALERLEDGYSGRGLRNWRPKTRRSVRNSLRRNGRGETRNSDCFLTWQSTWTEIRSIGRSLRPR